MRRTMLTDQQYNALVARAGGQTAISPTQLLSTQQQYLARKLYAERAADPYHPSALGSTTLAGSAVPYTVQPSRAAAAAVDNYADPQDIRAQLGAQLAAERRTGGVGGGGGALLPSPALVDYTGSQAAYVDHVSSRGVLTAPSLSPEVVAGAYPSHYPSPQRGGVAPLSSAELLAARARRSELAAAYPTGSASDVRRIAPSAASSYDPDSALFPQQHQQQQAAAAAGILGPGGPSVTGTRGRELERYLLSVQPEKLVHYAQSVLASPDQRRGYAPAPPPVSGNVHSLEDDRYSNYRRAKARRAGAIDFGGGREPREREREPGRGGRDREQPPYRERRDSGRERGKRSPDRRQTKSNDRQSSPGGGRRGQHQQNGGDEQQNKRSRPSEAPSGKSEKGAGAEVKSKKVENHESDKDSELGSLCADLSDSDVGEKVEKKSEEAATVIDDGPLAGMIFGCSSATFHECMRLQLFGLPAKSKEDVLRVTPGTKVFLFNFDTKELSGIFEAISHGGWQIQPEAFRDFGGFPAQVQVCCSEQRPNIPQSLFKHAIKENYVNQNRFRFDLNTKQVRELIRMFRQAERNLPRQQQQDPMADRYLSSRLPPEDYLARGGLEQQRPYSRHPQARFGPSRIVPYDDARVMMISMSANKTANFHKKSKRRASKRAQLKKGRKKRKVSTANKPQSPPSSPTADNCSLYSLSGEMNPEADAVTVNACGCADDDHDDGTSNTNNAVLVFREGVETDSSRNVDQLHKEITEPPPAKGTAPPSGPDHRLSPSKPPEEEFPQPLLQSDLDKVSSFLQDDSCNDGNFRLAGSRADEQGQGFGFDVPLQGGLSSGTVIKPSDCSLSCVGEGLCSEVERDFGTTGPAEALVNLGGNIVQQLASIADGDGHLSELDEKISEGSGDVGVPAHVNSHKDSVACESMSSQFGGGGEKLPDVPMDKVLTKIGDSKADCTLSSAGKDEELEVIAAAVDVGPEAPCVIERAITTAEVTIGPEAPCAREEVIVAAGVVCKDAEVEVIVAEVARCPEAPPCAREEVTVADSEVSVLLEDEGVIIASAVVSKDEELGVIAAEVAGESEAPCVREEVMAVAGLAGQDDEELEVTALDSEALVIIEGANIVSAFVAKDEEVDVRGAEVTIDSEAPSIREEMMVVTRAVHKDEELKATAAEVAIDSEAPSAREEVPIDVVSAGKAEELDETASELPLDPMVSEEVMFADENTSDDENVEVTVAEVATDSETACVREEEMIATEVVGRDEELEMIAPEIATDCGSPYGREEVMTEAEVAIESEAPCVREEETITAGAVGEDEELELIATEGAIESEAPSAREEAMTAAAESFGEDEGLEIISTELAIDSINPDVREEMMIASEAVGKDEGLEMISTEVAIDSEAPLDIEEGMINAETAGEDDDLGVFAAEREMIVARALSSELLASADMDGVVTVHDEVDQGEEVILGVDALDGEQPSPDQDVIHSDDEDEEEEVLPAGNAVDCELAASPDEDEDEEGEDQQDYDYDEGEGEDEDTVDVSVDGDLSNVEEEDEDEEEEDVEDIGEGPDDESDCDMD